MALRNINTKLHFLALALSISACTVIKPLYVPEGVLPGVVVMTTGAGLLLSRKITVKQVPGHDNKTLGVALLENGAFLAATGFVSSVKKNFPLRAFVSSGGINPPVLSALGLGLLHSHFGLSATGYLGSTLVVC
jgi:hypothetical protein